MPKDSPSQSERYGSFRTLSDRLDFAESQIGTGTVIAASGILPILRTGDTIDSVVSRYSPSAWGEGDSEFIVLTMEAIYGPVPLWEANSLYFVNRTVVRDASVDARKWQIEEFCAVAHAGNRARVEQGRLPHLRLDD